MKEIFGPLEVRRRLIRGELGFREYWIDKIQEAVNGSSSAGRIGTDSAGDTEQNAASILQVSDGNRAIRAIIK